MVEDEETSGVDSAELLNQGGEAGRVDRSYASIIVWVLVFFGGALVLSLFFSLPAMGLAALLAKLGGAEFDLTELKQGIDRVHLIPLFWATALAPIVVTWFMVWGKRLSWREAGFRAGGIAGDLLVGLGIGVGSFAVVPALAAAFGWVHIEYAPAGIGFLRTLPIAFYLLLVAAAAEEFALRGAPLMLIARRNVPAAVLVTSFIFAVTHGLNPGFNWVALLDILAAGIALAIARLRSGALWLPIGWHLGWNLSMGWLFGCVVSGHEASAAPLLATHLSGPELLTGGEFGPEAGLFSVVAEIVTLLFYLRFVPGRKEEAADASRGPTHSATGL
jgi:membrane protease YdiL (CAAX protease family)